MFLICRPASDGSHLFRGPRCAFLKDNREMNTSARSCSSTAQFVRYFQIMATSSITVPLHTRGLLIMYMRGRLWKRRRIKVANAAWRERWHVMRRQHISRCLFSLFRYTTILLLLQVRRIVVTAMCFVWWFPHGKAQWECNPQYIRRSMSSVVPQLVQAHCKNNTGFRLSAS